MCVDVGGGGEYVPRASFHLAMGGVIVAVAVAVAVDVSLFAGGRIAVYI